MTSELEESIVLSKISKSLERISRALEKISSQLERGGIILQDHIQEYEEGE